MKTLVFIQLALIVIAPYFSFCQHSTVNVNIDIPNRFKVGNSYYSSNYKGLNLLMFDLKADDPELYETLLPNFKAIEKKRNLAIVTGGVLELAGLSMVVVGFNKELNNMGSIGEFGNLESFNQSNKGADLMFAGGILSIFSGAVFALLYPNENDFYGFINKFNRHSGNKKLEWKFGFSPMPNKGFGVTLSKTF